MWMLLLATLPLLHGATYPAGVAASGLVDVTALAADLISAGFTNLDKTGGTDNRTRLQALVERFKQEAATNPAND